MAGIENLERCPFCPYAAEYPPANTNREFRCDNLDCQKVSCRLCREETHIPKTCEENARDNGIKAEHEIEEAMSAAMIRKCNKCGKQGNCPLFDDVNARHNAEVRRAEEEARRKVLESNLQINQDMLMFGMPEVKHAEEEARQEALEDDLQINQDILTPERRRARPVTFNKDMLLANQPHRAQGAVNSLQVPDKLPLLDALQALKKLQTPFRLPPQHQTPPQVREAQTPGPKNPGDFRGLPSVNDRRQLVESPDSPEYNPFKRRTNYQPRRALVRPGNDARPEISMSPKDLGSPMDRDKSVQRLPDPVPALQVSPQQEGWNHDEAPTVLDWTSIWRQAVAKGNEPDHATRAEFAGGTEVGNGAVNVRSRAPEAAMPAEHSQPQSNGFNLNGLLQPPAPNRPNWLVEARRRGIARGMLEPAGGNSKDKPFILD
ncbi:hypothetical protein CTA2_12744 [Colletotrichum tanaceti]|nr:hypothetical protein CTA2_12744 [Colletotrichum tanaceti]